jgi:hypothetical protein
MIVEDDCDDQLHDLAGELSGPIDWAQQRSPWLSRAYIGRV